MTAFAAILEKRGAPLAVGAVADALGSVYDRGTKIVELGACALLVAPLHHCDSAPVVLPSGVAVAGQIVLEGKSGIAAALDVPASAAPAALVGAARDRWGERFTEYLSGEYAFTLWDSHARTLVCARDGMGLRLLYVAEGPETVIVTNVLAAALAHPAISHDLDQAALLEFLACGGAGDDGRTCYRHVRVVPPGHTLSVDVHRNSTRMHRHWHFPARQPAAPRGDGAILEQYRSTLADAVRDRATERGTAIFLSGGVDSTTIAAAARDVAPGAVAHAITARYPGHATDSELQFTRLAAARLDLPLTVVDGDRYGAWRGLGAFPRAPEPLDEPMLADWREIVVSAAARGTVALYGEDGDALFCPPGWRALRNAGSTASIAGAAARYVLDEGRRPYLGLRWRERLGIVPARPSDGVPGWLTRDAHEALARREAATILGHRATLLPEHPTRPQTQARLISTTYCRDFALTIAPETTCAAVELRFPLFDTRVVQLVVSLPAIPWCQHKTLPRRAFRGHLPDAVLDRPKTPLAGFNEAAVAAWRKSKAGARPLNEPLASWIDADDWQRTLDRGSPGAVMTAWRVLALDAWMTAPVVANRGGTCIP